MYHDVLRLFWKGNHLLIIGQTSPFAERRMKPAGMVNWGWFVAFNFGRLFPSRPAPLYFGVTCFRMASTHLRLLVGVSLSLIACVRSLDPVCLSVSLCSRSLRADCASQARLSCSHRHPTCISLRSLLQRASISYHYKPLIFLFLLFPPIEHLYRIVAIVFPSSFYYFHPPLFSFSLL